MFDPFSFKNTLGQMPKSDDFLFQNEAPAAITKDGELRRFKGVAYTGDMIQRHPYWGNVIFDLSSITVPPKMPMLFNHNTDAIAGYSDESSVDSAGINLQGNLSKSTPEGQRIAALSDEGFPWQMSVRISPARIEELQAGNTAVVNGRTIQGPAYIFRDSKLSETSFTPTGWDAGTSATALSRFNGTTPKEEQMTKELEDQVAKLTTELTASKEAVAKLTAELTAANTKLTDAQAVVDNAAKAGRIEKLKTAYAQAGLEFTDDNAKFAAETTDDVVDQLVVTFSKLAEGRKQDGLNLFGHTAQDGRAQSKDEAGDVLLSLCDSKAQEFAKTRK